MSGSGAGGRERRFRALLVGVDHYSDPLFRSMPFITTELRALAETLKEAGYAEAEVIDADERNGTAIKDEVERFISYAAPGDHLLLVLSGHGFSKDGADYLITGPAHYTSRHFHEKCLRIEFGDYLMDADADQLVVVIDACRAELDTYSKAGVDELTWSKGATGYGDTAPLDWPRYAHVYACTRYGKAQFGPAVGPVLDEDTSTDDEVKGFSYFTRALTELARDATAPGFLDAMEPLLDERVRTIGQENRSRSDQCVQVNYATGRDGLLLFPDREPGARPQQPEHPWQKAAADHEAWRRVICERLDESEKAQAVAQVRDAVGRLVGLWGRETDLADAWLAEHGDIWRPAGMEGRMGRSIAMMLHDSGPARARADANLDTPGPRLSLTEAALLVAGPYLYTAFGTRFAYLARDIRPWTLVDGPPATESCGFADRGAFERYCAGQLALKDRERRARQRGRDHEARAVAWWLARQWLLRGPATRQAVRQSGLAGLVALPDEPEFEPQLVREVLRPARLWRLAELIGLDLEQPPSAEQDTVAAQDAAEHIVDWQKTGTLLTIAHHMAVDPLLLSSLVAEHLGISAPVDGAAFRASLEAASWLRDGPRRRVLSTECSHQAVELALRDHTDALDRAVRALLHGPAGERATAWGIPAVFGAGKVKPALGEDGKPLYDRADVRFRLDGDRVRDLLMGEQLYQDRTLALRELYQNALDACRYRRARTELWNLTHPDDPDPWQGEIVFTQGEDDDGRAYIECKDNGIGMGRHALRHLFAFAGSRFVEEREFLEERAEWAAEGIPFHANSRFGIGVLSYFMLADEIRVTTSRLKRDFGFGEKLVVDIDGPGALFRVRPKGVARWSGTAVRLYLRNPQDEVSCGEVMRKHLWVSDFSVTVKEREKEPLRWRPGMLSAYVDRDTTDSSGPFEEDETVPVLDAGDGVWWRGGRGAVLADGLWAGEARFGCVVNLTGRHAPVLRLDRRAMLDDHEEHVRELLADKAPALFDEGGGVLSLAWLHALAIGGWPERGRRALPPSGRSERRQALLADLIAAQAVARGHRFSFTADGTEMVADSAVVGCCPGDQPLLSRSRAVGGAAVIVDDSFVFGEWRARIWAAAYPEGGVRPSSPLPVARPTDELLLSDVEEQDGTSVSLGALLSAARAAGVPVAYAAARLREFGLEPPDDEVVLSRLEDVSSLQALSVDGDGIPPWFPTGASLTVPMLRQAAKPQEDLRSLARLLAGLGFRVPSEEELDAAVVPDQWQRGRDNMATLVLRHHLEPDGPELPRDRPVTMIQLVLAARSFPGQRDRIAEAFTVAGHRLPTDAVPGRADEMDLALISRDGDAQPPWRSEGQPVPLHHVLRVSRARQVSAERLVDRLAALGLTPPELPDAEDLRVYGRLVDDVIRFYDSGRYSTAVLPPVLHPAAVLSLARDHALPDVEIARRLTALGYTVPGLESPRGVGGYLDLVLLSRDQQGLEPWLDEDSPVPWHHVVRAAHTYEHTRAEIARALIRCGLEVVPEPPTGDWTPGDDVIALRGRSQSAHGWLTADGPVPLTHILATAHHLNRTPTAIAHRLRQLGHTLPDDIEFTDTDRP